MPMEFIDSLDEKQAIVAQAIARKAKEMGVDPRLAVTLAFRESNLNQGDASNPTKGSSGEIGVMQVMPSTAKQYGYNPKELNDLDRNIDIGLQILKANIAKFNDPILAVAAYNAGENHPYFTDPQKYSLPDTTKQYIKDIQAYGGFSGTPEEKPSAPAPDTTPESEANYKEMLEKNLPGLMGAGMGASAGVGMTGAQKAKSAMDMVGKFLEAQTAAAKQVPITGVNMPAQGMVGAAPEMGGLPPAGGPLSNTPAGGRMTQNWIKAQDTLGRYADVGQKARSMGEAHRLKELAIAAEDKIRQIAPEMAQDVNRAGLYVPTQTGAGPRGARTVPINPPQPATSLLDDAIAKLNTIAKGGLRVVSSAPVAGALGGYGAGMSAQEAVERGASGDKTGAGLAGLGILGALAAVPHPAARAVGFGASAVSPLSLMIMDRYRKILGEPAPAPASPAEMQQAQKPAFVYPNP